MTIRSPHTMSNHALLVSFAQGDQAAARHLTDRFMPKIYAHAYHRLQNVADAEDVAQEAFFRLWKMAPNWRQEKAQISTWLYRVVMNLTYDKLRLKSAEHLDTDTEPMDNALSVGEHLDEQYRTKALYAAMSELPDRQRLALQLRHLDDLSNPEIAEIMELSIEAVESLIARGKRKLTDVLRDQKSELGYSHGSE